MATIRGTADLRRPMLRIGDIVEFTLPNGTKRRYTVGTNKLSLTDGSGKDGVIFRDLTGIEDPFTCDGTMCLKSSKDGGSNNGYAKRWYGYPPTDGAGDGRKGWPGYKKGDMTAATKLVERIFVLLEAAHSDTHGVKPVTAAEPCRTAVVLHPLPTTTYLPVTPA